MDGQTDRQTDGQTDVGHINLIGGLVTRNPPNKNLTVSNKYSSKTVLLTGHTDNHKIINLISLLNKCD